MYVLINNYSLSTEPDVDSHKRITLSPGLRLVYGQHIMFIITIIKIAQNNHYVFENHYVFVTSAL